MKISDFLSPSEVLVNVRATDKRQLLQDLAQKAAPKLDISADRIVSELLKREELGSTGMGSGVAIPHARFDAIKSPFGMLARLKPAIEFDAIDGQRVDLVFVLLLSAGAEGEQLGALALVARKLRDSADLIQIRRAKNASDLYAAVVG
jgi:PTS system nitrogen regulatory IIA component